MLHINQVLNQTFSPDELKQILASYDHIELTDDETNHALLIAKIRKEAILREKERQQRADENRRALTGTRWSPEQTAQFAKYRAAQFIKRPLVIDEYNQPVFDLLCLYFSQDAAFERAATEIGIANPSLEKGLLLCGNPGTGKTYFMKVFMRNQRQGFDIVNAATIASHYAEIGSIDTFLDLNQNAVNDPSNFYQRFIGLCIDDIGTEDVKNHFGNKVNVIGQLLEAKYSRNLVGPVLHATTNLTADGLRTFYGDRVISRMREIFNLIVMDGADRRK